MMCELYVCVGVCVCMGEALGEEGGLAGQRLRAQLSALLQKGAWDLIGDPG